MKIASLVLMFFAANFASADETAVADQMTCAQAQSFGSAHRYIDYDRSSYGGSGVGRVYLFPISQCAGSEYMIRVNTRDSRSCAVGCEPNPGSGN